MRLAELEINAQIEGFDEEKYLSANPDVAVAVKAGMFPSGYAHYQRHGSAEGRKLRDATLIDDIRRTKMRSLEPLLRLDLPHEQRDGKFDFLTNELAASARITDTSNISSNGYDSEIVKLIERHADGMVLDCGAGRRDVYFENVVNFEIVDYDTTDVLGVGEMLPFRDGAFDAVISVAVLEHVRDPFQCAKEIVRVLKPGGELFCCVPFLQPYHGYPHHYFNMTQQGLVSLFEETVDIQSVAVTDALHPIFTLTWILSRWHECLPSSVARSFSEMRVADLMSIPENYLENSFCSELSPLGRRDLASANLVTGRRKS